MNAPERLPLPDVQAAADLRCLAIQRVGIKDLRHPIRVRADDGAVNTTVATVDMYVGLPPEQKGTHMSRFVEILENHGQDISNAGFAEMFDRMLDRLDAPTGLLEMRFPYFLTKTAPVSGVQSLLDYDVTMRRERRQGEGSTDYWLQVLVPVTSLCPCSKEISAYGAHNQRSHVTIKALVVDAVAIRDRKSVV